MTITETRSKSTEESVKKLDMQLQNYMETNDARLEGLAKKMDLLMEKLIPNQEGILGSAPGLQLDASGSRLHKNDQFEQARFQRSNHHGRFEFPFFDGVDPCSWLRKGERYFHYNRILDPDEKLEVAVLHLTGKAEAWFFSYHVSKGVIKWHEFTEEICKRFEGASNSKFNLIGEFKKVEQKGTVDEYLERFEDLKAWVLIRNPTIPEDFFLEFFVEGLKEEIRHTIKMLNPFTLSQAVDKARYQERLIQVQNRKERSQWGRSNITGYNQTNGVMVKGANSSVGGQGNKLLELRKAQGLCYKCGEKYHVGHQCKTKQLNTMSASIDPTELEQSEGIEGDVKELEEMPGEEIMDEAISLNALSGTEVPNTIKLGGEAKRNKITILLDSGSTHSFLDLETARRIGCQIIEAVPMRVTVANGNHITSLHSCPRFKWKIQGVEFEDAVRLVRLGGNDMILGGDWMKGHNPVLLDFIEYKVQVTHKGKRVELKGIYSKGELKSMTAVGVRQLLKKGQAIWAHLFTLSAQKIPMTEEIPAEIVEVLADFKDVFDEPTSLPPKRGHDHHIPLKSNANPVSRRP
uniref:Ty3 transposon capsid-like protein domain-containing protein n=1 Tax=Nicotiana tabacum TaxID=4097 RepID=A0A1S3YB75_TOBAC|nr:PREDICTED: uncharacterized protein LOC107774272 [Nicotiana tabacum]